MTTVGAKRNPAKNPAMITPVTVTLKPSSTERTPMTAPFKPLPTISSPRPTKSGHVPERAASVGSESVARTVAVRS